MKQVQYDTYAPCPKGWFIQNKTEKSPLTLFLQGRPLGVIFYFVLDKSSFRYALKFLPLKKIAKLDENCGHSAKKSHTTLSKTSPFKAPKNINK